MRRRRLNISKDIDTAMDLAGLTKLDGVTWRIEPVGAMRVPAILYADATLIKDMDDNRHGRQGGRTGSLLSLGICVW